jgi:ppGpp synthetase/RelA/SpoT-type nucleotidyltranferase
MSEMDFEGALKWVDDAFADIDESRAKLRKSSPVLDRVEGRIKTIQLALRLAKRVQSGDVSEKMSEAGGDKDGTYYGDADVDAIFKAMSQQLMKEVSDE